MNLNHHSKDFKRRLRVLNQHETHRITTARDSLHPQEWMDKEALAKLHDDIKFTQTVMREEALKRWEQ